MIRRKRHPRGSFLRTCRPEWRRAWWLAAPCCLLLCVLSTPGIAQQADEQKAEAEAWKEVVAQLDEGRARVRADRVVLADAEARLIASPGAPMRVLEYRRDQAELQLFGHALDWLGTLAEQAAQEKDISAYRSEVASLLVALPARIRTADERVRARTVFPAADAEAADQAATDGVLLSDLEARRRLIEVRVEAIAFAKGLGVDNAAELALVRAELEEHAAMLSALLELAIEDASLQQARLALLPDDAEVKALAAVTANRVEMYTGVLGQLTPLLAGVELETTEYDKQLLAVTGDLSTDVLDVSVLGGMLSDWSAMISTTVVDNAPTMLLRVALFLLIVFVSLKAGKLVQRLLERALSAAQVELSQLLHRMVLSGVRNLIVLLGLLLGLSQLGLSLGPVLAGLGIAGFVLGFALQDSLSNFASGLMILLYRPLDVGDLVEAGGVFGTVSHMSLVNTTILTLDNQTLIVPNNMIWTQVIKNVTKQRTRRVDMVFGISYGDDIPKAEGVLMEVLEKHEKVLSDPPPNVRVHELGDSSVNFVVRPWCETDDYWDVFWDVTKEVKMRFDAEGISIPFPQRDVHFYPTAVNEGVPKGALAEPLSRSAEVNEPPPASDADADEGEGEQ